VRHLEGVLKAGQSIWKMLLSPVVALVVVVAKGSNHQPIVAVSLGFISLDQK